MLYSVLKDSYIYDLHIKDSYIYDLHISHSICKTDQYYHQIADMRANHVRPPNEFMVEATGSEPGPSHLSATPLFV